MKTPNFWHKKNLLAYLLWPLSGLYLLGHFFNYWLRFLGRNSGENIQPIICIGNLVAGGAGKTPVAIEIGRILQELEIDFTYLSRGYGGQITDFTQVDDKKHCAQNVGDEPLLLSVIAPTFICQDRALGANLIAQIPKTQLQSKLIIIDDGLQNSSINKDFSILVIDGNYGFGNGLIMPAGPLREPIRVGLKRADLIIILGQDRDQIVQKSIAQFAAHKKIIIGKIVAINSEKYHHQSVIAFCGIGRPEKFFASLKQNNINISAQFSYPDHYQYQEQDLQKMLDLAQKNSQKLITTKKDWIRLETIYQKQIDYLDIKIEFENIQYLKEKLTAIANG